MTPLPRKLLAVLGLPLLFAASAHGQVSKSGAGYLFRLKFDKGEAVRFKVPVSITNLEAQPVSLMLHLDLKVLKLQGTLATVKAHLASGSVNGQSLLPDQTHEVEIDNLGKYHGNVSGLSGFAIQYPVQPVRIGGAFVSPVPTALGNSALSGNAGSADAVFTFRGFVNTPLGKAARLTFVVAGNQAPSGSILVSVKDGVLIRYYTKFYVTVGAQSQAKVTAQILRE